MIKRIRHNFHNFFALSLFVFVHLTSMVFIEKNNQFPYSYTDYMYIFTRMTCFYKAFEIYGNTGKGSYPNISDEFNVSCQDLCHHKAGNHQGLELIVLFSNSSTRITSSQNQNQNVSLITCSFPGETEKIYNTTDNESTTETLLPTSATINESTLTPTDTSASTSWVDTTSITSQTPKVSDSKDTTKTDATISAEKSTTNPSSCASPRQSKSTCTRASSPGAFVGAVIGGAVLGAVIASTVFVFFHDRLPNLCKRKTLGGMKNPVYKSEDIQLEDRQSPPDQRTENYNEIIEPTLHVPNPSLPQHENSSSKDDVYNHLHENQYKKSEKGGGSDNYDHAVLATADGSGYGMVSIDRKISDNYSEVDPTKISNSATPRSEKNNPYFTLEAQDD